MRTDEFGDAVGEFEAERLVNCATVRLQRSEAEQLRGQRGAHSTAAALHAVGEQLVRLAEPLAQLVDVPRVHQREQVAAERVALLK